MPCARFAAVSVFLCGCACRLSHAVTKQQDFQAEVYETRASLERERAIALEYQQRALAATGIQAGSSSAAGSATDAVLRRRNDALIRAMVLRLYRVIATGGADSMKTPRGASNSKLDFSESSGDNSKQAVRVCDFSDLVVLL